LSHALSGTGKLLKKGYLALFLSLVPLVFNKTFNLWSIMAGIGVNRGRIWAGL